MDGPTLDLGCGINKLAGAIGVDRNPRAAPDVLADIDRGHLPFRDSSVAEVRLIHVIEHVASVMNTVEEAHRVLRPGGLLRIETPHCTDASSFADPTHRWHLNTFSFRYFTEPSDYRYYSECQFRQRRLQVKTLRLWRLLGFELAINHSRTFRKFWEYYLSHLVRGKAMAFELEAVK